MHGIDGLCWGDPVSAGIMETERAVKNNASGILTLKQCSVLRRCEKHGLADLQDRICEDIDAGGFEMEARQCSARHHFERWCPLRRIPGFSSESPPRQAAGPGKIC